MVMTYNNMNITKEVFMTASKYIWTIEKQTSNGITGYNIYLLRPESENKEIIKVYGIGSYWNNKKGYYHHVGWGSSRPLDIILDIGYSLGCKFEDIQQSKITQL